MLCRYTKKKRNRHFKGVKSLKKSKYNLILREIVLLTRTKKSDREIEFQI
jgi:hypothetical protein